MISCYSFGSATYSTFLLLNIKLIFACLLLHLSVFTLGCSGDRKAATVSLYPNVIVDISLNNNIYRHLNLKCI